MTARRDLRVEARDNRKRTAYIAPNIVRWLWMELSSGGPEKARRFFIGSGRLRLRGKTSEDLKLLELLDPVAEATGYEIVRLRLMGGFERRLQIMAERPDGQMEIEDCTRLSRAISDVVDAADPISGEYTLEVSSPGIDRPLTRLKDFATWQGCEARIELDRMAEGRKRFRGHLAGIEGQDVLIDLEGETDHTAHLPFGWIVEAKLVLTDELMKRGAAEREARLAAQTQSQKEEVNP